MSPAIVTDSTADLPPGLAEELGVRVVPLYVRFGEEVFSDGVDIGPDEFYRRLVTSPDLPKTAAPSPEDFARVYRELAGEAVVSIHISGKLSATCDSARRALDLVPGAAVDIIDSLSCSMGTGLLVILAALWAREGRGAAEISSRLRELIPGKVHLFGLVDNLEYLHKGGRLGKAQVFLGSLLRIKPILEVRDGEAHPLERVRTRARAIERMLELAAAFPSIQALAVLHSTTPDDARELARRLKDIFPGEIYLSQFGPVLGTYVGPGTLGIALVEG